MNILYYFKEKDIPMDKWQRIQIFDELARQGCMVHVFNPLGYSSLEEANERVVEQIRNGAYHLFMTPHGHLDIFPETIIRIRETGLPTLLICFDNLIVPYMHEQVAPLFDLVWLTSQDTKYLFDKWGCNSICLPYASNPHVFQAMSTTEIERVAFAGTPYGSRINHLNCLLNHHVPVSLFANVNSNSNSGASSGYSFSTIYNLLRFGIGRRVMLGAVKQKLFTLNKLNSHSSELELQLPVNFLDLNKVFSAYALSLSTTEARNTGVLKKPVKIVNLRSFEIPMSGGLQICSYSNELACYFEENREILFYRNEDEFIEKANFYLKPEQSGVRSKMKFAARKRAAAEHTWFRRFNLAFEKLGIHAGGN